MDENLQDPLKPLNKIMVPDERQNFFLGSLEGRHAELQNIILIGTVPLEVRQLFETSKNLSLYSWFVYRFHQVAELISFAAIEMALRERYLAENPIDSKSNQKTLNLYKLMQHAKKEKWLTNQGFSDLYALAKHHAEYKKMIKKMETHDFAVAPSMPIDEPTQEEIQEALAGVDRVNAVAENANKIRNDLAHGSSRLNPSSISTLRLNADIINQIYSEQAL